MLYIHILIWCAIAIYARYIFRREMILRMRFKILERRDQIAHQRKELAENVCALTADGWDKSLREYTALGQEFDALGHQFYQLEYEFSRIGVIFDKRV